MENLIQLQNGHKSYGSKLLFERASFSVNSEEHVGVIGPNGAGKTTLFRILTDHEELDSGLVVRSRSLRQAYLSQHDHWEKDETVEHFITKESQLQAWELKQIGERLELLPHHYETPIQSLSGGYRMRAKLLRLMGFQPNLMLLDEPTNYLDLETILVLERFLQEFEGAFLLISHDREFLRRTTDHILEVETGEITKFNGNIDDYFEQKNLLKAQLQARALAVEDKRQQILDFVSRFGAKATKAKQAQSRLKSLSKLEKIEVKPLPLEAKIPISQPTRKSRILIQAKDASLGYGEKKVLSNVNLVIEWGNHYSVVGLNGAGKTTLLKGLSHRLEPSEGSIEQTQNNSFAYFGQHVSEELDPSHTVYEALENKAHPDVKPQEILNLAGALLFRGDEVRKPIRVLSGGEKTRVALGQVLLQKANCLILDEPTNHLDFHTVEGLTQALESYPGTLLVVSHDRGFTQRVGKKILEVNHGKVSSYPGSYDEYVWSISQHGTASARSQEKKVAPPDEVSSQPKKVKKNTSKDQQKLMRRLGAEVRRVEASLEKSHEELQKLNAMLSSANADQIREASQEMSQIQVKIQELETDWESLMSQIEEQESQ